mgnify:CR=1 FL=1
MAKNKTQSLRISFYPKEVYHKLTVALAFEGELYQSELEKEINKKYFDSLGDERKKQLLKVYDGMTYEQRNPKQKTKRRITAKEAVSCSIFRRSINF